MDGVRNVCSWALRVLCTRVGGNNFRLGHGWVFDRATEIAARLANTPHPEDAPLDHEWYVDVRPIAGSRDELDL